MAKPRKEGSGWSVRSRFQGHSLYISGCATSAGAKKKMDERVAELSSGGKAKGFGPHGTMVAQAMQDYGLERLIFMKDARQEADRINRFLRAAGLATLKLSQCKPTVLHSRVASPRSAIRHRVTQVDSLPGSIRNRTQTVLSTSATAAHHCAPCCVTSTAWLMPTAAS